MKYYCLNYVITEIKLFYVDFKTSFLEVAMSDSLVRN